MSLFLRLLGDEDKGAALEAAVRSVAAGAPDDQVFKVDPGSFEQVPGAPFAYWVSESIRQLFKATPQFEQRERYARRGPSTCDDFRYLRLWWDAPAKRRHGLGEWRDFSKGGAFSPFYSDIHLLVEWETARATFLGFFGRPGRMIEKPESVDYFFRPGLTWPRRTQKGLALRAMPAGCIFADKGPAAFVAGDAPESLLALLALTNSSAFRALVELQMAFGSYEVGVIQRTPVPDLSAEDEQALAGLARRAWSLKRSLDTGQLTSHAFVLPALLQVEGPDLAARVAAWTERVRETDDALAGIQTEIDARCFDLYGFDAADRAAALGTSENPLAEAETDDEGAEGEDAEQAAPLDAKGLAAELFDWLVGVAFGRFDLRLATGELLPPPEPQPFDPLPVCSPGMLTGNDGLPLDRPPPGYPLDFPADGILVDDAGIDGNAPADADLLRRVQQVLGIIWGDQAPRMEAELARLLGVRSLRDWLRRPSGYFADHLGRWSKSRRRAPIFWPLSTGSGGYTLWLYYPRLTDQTLYTCVNEQIDPKLRAIERDLARLRTAGQPDTKARKSVDALVELGRELQAMREELLQVAKLPYQPNQNDGVLITAAPLWPLFRHMPWRNGLKTCWNELEAGRYEWAHLAMALWPARVREVCRRDRSIAIAHGLEHLFGQD